MKQPLEPRGLHVLVVEADPSRARVLGEMVRGATPGAGPAAHAGSLAEARDALRARPADIILLNPSLADCAGLATVRVIRALAPDAAVIVLTGLDDEAVAAEALAIGVQDYLAMEELSDRLLARSIRNALARTRAEAAWRASEARFRSLFEHTLDAVLLTTPDGAVLAANPAACSMFGYSEEEFRSLGRGAVADREDPRLAAAIEERRRTGRFIGELTFIRKDGSRIAVELSSHVFRDGDGDERTSMFIRDITARKQAEEALAARERQYRGLVQGLHDGVFICDAQNRIVEATGRMGELVGRGPEELLGMTVAELVDPEDLASAPLRREELQRTGKLVSERRLRRADGGSVPVEVASVLLGDGGVECVVRDITERRRTEREKSLLAAAGQVFASSLASREMLRSIAGLVVPEHADWCVVDVLSEDGSPEIIEVVTADARKGEVLRSMLDAYPHGASPETNPVGRVLQTGEPLLLREILPRQLEGMAQDARHLELARALGPVSSMVVPLVARGRILGAMTLTAAESRRVFDERDLELAMELARRAALAVEKARLHERLEQAVQARDQVLGYVAHDLRNPLGAIAIFAGLLLNESVPPAQRRPSLEAILQATGQMDRLIQDLLDVARIEAAQLGLDPEPLEAGAMVADAMPMLHAAAREAGVELRVELPGDLPRVLADRNRVVQVLSNLLGNGIRFTPRGGTVTLRARSLGAEVLFAVADTGPGIPTADLPHLFDRFWQARRTHSGGAGLGLAIAKGIVEAAGGRIWAASEPGHGATFFFTLPCAAGAECAAGATPAEGMPPARSPAPDADPLRVLLVDDHPVIRRGLREMLAAGGRFDVAGEAGSGEEAVRLAAELRPDVVVMDLAMPGMDGIEATRRITAALPGVRVLALTAEPEDRWLLKVLDAGGSGLVQKSAAHRDLVHALETVAGGQAFLYPTGSLILMRSLRDGTRTGPGDPLAGLSEPERKVALLTAQGFTSREIGKRLFLSPRTVDSYRSQVMKKLGLGHRAELVRLTVGAGLLRPE